MNLLTETNASNHKDMVDMEHDGSPNVYTVGFLFDWSGGVLLINKLKPAWQKGKVNGIGGKVEKESPMASMHREFKDESGIPEYQDWRHFATVTNERRDFILFFFAATCGRDRPNPTNPEEEKCEWRRLAEVFVMKGDRKVMNLDYLLPLGNHKDNPVAYIIEQ